MAKTNRNNSEEIYIAERVAIFTERMKRKGFEVREDGDKLVISHNGEQVATYKKSNFRPCQRRND